LKRTLSPWTIATGAVLATVCFAAYADTPAPSAPPAPPAPPTAASLPTPATTTTTTVSTTTTSTTEPGPPGAAATVDGHVIPLQDVIDYAMRLGFQRITDDLVDNYLFQREADKQHVTATDAEIDAKIDDLKKQIAPATLEQALQTHHESLARLRDEFRLSIITDKLCDARVQPVHMLHIEHILIMAKGPGFDPAEPQAHPVPDALALINKVQADLKKGKSFEECAKEYSQDDATKDQGGEAGAIYKDSPGDPDFMKAAMALNVGQISQPIKDVYGYELVKALSSSESHPKSEDAFYDKAWKQYLYQQAQFQRPLLLNELRLASKISYYAPPDASGN